jgi:hypothetical protein
MQKLVAQMLVKFISEINKLVTKPSKYGCPMPCHHTSYTSKVAYMHANTWFDPWDLVFILSNFSF